ncbi:MAG: hypothetical protein RIB30_15740 [Thalassospira sp.]|uniref:hypothetical protein n=1 Tax=Thalassospira sp. TaxID=1912094 RepID=UPI0032EB6D72
MLQINTGKLFKNGIGRTNNLRGVLYSNIWLPTEDIETNAGTLRATDGGRDNRAIVYELEERIEESSIKPGALVSHTVQPYLQDFSILASFGLRCTFSDNENTVKRLISENAEFSSHYPPNKFVRRFFDNRIAPQQNDRDQFIDLVKDLVALERRLFLVAMRSIRTFVAGLHRIPDDLGLAYTLLVSSVETLIHERTNQPSDWENVNEPIRIAVDKALDDASEKTARAVREAIIGVDNGSLARSYREFILNKIDPDYFRSEDVQLGAAVTRWQLDQALRQAYALRSKYIHTASPLPDELTMPHQYGETTEVDRRPALTLQGLARITHHVIRTFIKDGHKIEFENYEYNRERAGVVTVQLAPQYWLAQPLSDPKQARRKFEGLLSQLSDLTLRKKGTVLTDLKPILPEVDTMLPQAIAEAKPALFSLYVLFNCMVREEDQIPNWRNFLTRHPNIDQLPASEILMLRTIVNTHEWELTVHKEAYDRYWKERPTRSGLHAPRLFEAAASLELAERYRKNGNVDASKNLVSDAVELHPGHNDLLELENNYSKVKTINWREILVPHQEPN